MEGLLESVEACADRKLGLELEGAQALHNGRVIRVVENGVFELAVDLRIGP